MMTLFFCLLRSKSWVSFFDSPLFVFPHLFRQWVLRAPSPHHLYSQHSRSSHHHLSLFNCSPCFCHCLSTTLFIYTTAQVIFFKVIHLRLDHVTYELQTLQWFSFSFRVKAQSSCFDLQGFSSSLSISSPSPSRVSLASPHRTPCLRVQALADYSCGILC